MNEHRPYSLEDLEAALRRVQVSSQTAGIPYAAMKQASGGVRFFLLAHQNAMLFFHAVPSYAKCHPTYHKHKPKRTGRFFSSYRTLSLSVDELRLAEVLWALDEEEKIWQSAGGEQMGRSSCMLVTFVDLETALIRTGQGLPVGALSSDFAEAFDTAWPAATILQLHEHARIRGEKLHMASEFIKDTTVYVVKGSQRTEPVELVVGMPEGRRLSPAF